VLEKEIYADYIVHLGDFYEDIENNYDLIAGKKLFRVPGILHPGYFTQEIPYYQDFKLNGITIAAVHAPYDIRRIPLKADIILFGHTHKQDYFTENQALLINPGHLKSETDRGFPASYCLIEFIDNNIIIKFKDYRCNLTQEFSLEKKT
jgi:hypothetical protein